MVRGRVAAALLVVAHQGKVHHPEEVPLVRRNGQQAALDQELGRLEADAPEDRACPLPRGLAGVVSFLSPCVLPVLPGYLTYLAARSSGREVGQVSRLRILFHGIAFVAGFSIVFIMLGATASAIGRFLYAYREWITRIGGVMIVIFGLQISGWLQFPLLGLEIRKHAEPNPRLGYISSFLMGLFFSAGWTPCVGPTLGIVLTIAGTGASIARGIFLLALYSLGLGLPFIITALAIDRVGIWMRRMTNLTRYVTLAAGIFLVPVGILLILGQLNILGELFPGLGIYI